jgi:thiol-disulfide isomerase/thioredoxin
MMSAFMLPALLWALIQSVTPVEMKALIKPASRPLVVHAWASWCGPCLAELPELATGLGKRDVDVVWVNLDGDPQKGERVLLKLGKTPGRQVRPATAEAYAALRALDDKWDGELPATWLLATDGSVQLSQRGLSDLDELWKRIDQTRRRGK